MIAIFKYQICTPWPFVATLALLNINIYFFLSFSSQHNNLPTVTIQKMLIVNRADFGEMIVAIFHLRGLVWCNAQS